MTEEKELEMSLEKNEWVSIPNFKEIKKKMEIVAKNTLLKDQRMNIRIAKRDLEGLKTKALEQGLPYQTLVSSILHKYINGNLVEREV
jgi:predicted DNA binding CopG/RHH family protein